MKTIRTRSSKSLGPTLFITPCLVNLLACVFFLVFRPAGISSIEERELMRREPGMFFVNSADPRTFVAERPLYQWNEWHGGEATWVKVVETLNYPALTGAEVLTDIWSAYAAPRSIGSFRGDTWVRAWLYLALSSAQWLIVGAVAAWFFGRRRANRPKASEPASQSDLGPKHTTHTDTGMTP
jgi:hypothetical protein